MDALGPVQQAWRLTFAAATGTGPGGSRGRSGTRRWRRGTGWPSPTRWRPRCWAAAEAALAAGDRDGAARRLQRAAELAGQLGARPLGTEIAALARHARLDLGAGRPAEPGPARTGWA